MVREPVHFHHKPGLVIDSALGCDLIELYTHFFKKQVLFHIFFYILILCIFINSAYMKNAACILYIAYTESIRN